MKKIILIVAALVTSLTLTSCAGLSQFGENLNRALKGVDATMTTYNQNGVVIDRVKGNSFRVTRDERFDTSDSDGTSKNDSGVLLISLGDSHISHVGSSMVLAQEGLTDVMSSTGARVDFTSTDPGMPWLNDLIEKHRNLWKGKSKTIMIRSQDGTPIAVYTGNAVEMFASDVPKSTTLRVDGQYLFIYRCDYTIYDTDLLK